MSKQKEGAPTNTDREAKKAVINICTLNADNDKEWIAIMRWISMGRYLIKWINDIGKESVNRALQYNHEEK